MPADRRAAGAHRAGRSEGDLKRSSARARAPAPGATEAAARAALDAVPLPVLLVDDRGEIAFANRALRGRLNGAAATGAFASCFPEYAAALGGRLDAAREVAVTRRSNGAAVQERLVVRSTPWGAAITVLDETPLAEASLQSAQATRLASLGFMVAGVCHEVSNPLAAIHSMVQILRSKRGGSPAMLEKGLASISSNIGRILTITRTLTDFSRVGDGPVEPVQVARAVDEATALLWHQADAHGVTVEAAVARGAAVLARAGQVERVVYNVLLNAAQAMGGRGRVRVAGERRAERVVLEIRDEGPGIAPEHLARVFEPFFTTKPNGTGTGLGLAVSSEIVHELGGEMRAANLPGGGACFTIEFPAAPGAADA